MKTGRSPSRQHKGGCAGSGVAGGGTSPAAGGGGAAVAAAAWAAAGGAAGASGASRPKPGTAAAVALFSTGTLPTYA